MNKTILITFSLLFFFSIAFGQKKDTIYGKVKSVREQLNFLDKDRQNKKLFSTEGDYGHYGFSSARFTKSRFHNWWYNTPFVHYSNYYKEFNKKGKPTSEMWFYKDGDTVRTYQYKYDKKDNLIQVKKIYAPEDYTCRNFKFNSKNKVKSSIYFESDRPSSYTYREYLYDSKSNLIQVKSFDEDGEMSSMKYKYDVNSRKTIDIIHKPHVYIKKGRSTGPKKDSIGLNKINKKYFYNKEGNLNETHYYDSDSYDNFDSKLTRKVKNVYSNGLLTNTYHIRDTINSINKYEYDNQKRKKKVIVMFSKSPNYNRSTEYFYNKNGDINKIIYIEKKSPVIVQFKYSFDLQNNWTKQVKSVNGKKLYVWTREIEYY